MNSFATPLTNNSSVTDGSSPRKSKNWDGMLSGDASLSPVLDSFIGGATTESVNVSGRSSRLTDVRTCFEGLTSKATSPCSKVVDVALNQSINGYT